MTKLKLHKKNLHQYKTVVMLSLLMIAIVFMSRSQAANVKITFNHKAFTELLGTGKATNTETASALLALKNISTPYRFEYLPYSRAHLQMKREDVPICRLLSLKTEARQAQFLFSAPMAFRASQRLFSSTQLAKIPVSIFNKNSEIISLSTLMSLYPKSVLVTSLGMSYGDYIDAEITKIDPEQISIHRGFNFHDSREKMFLRGRADFVIAFPDAIARLNKEYGDGGFNSYKIANIPAVLTSHLMCNTRPESAKLIAEVNKNLHKLYMQPEFINAHTDYLPFQDHETLINHIKQYAADTAVIEP